MIRKKSQRQILAENFGNPDLDGKGKELKYTISTAGATFSGTGSDITDGMPVRVGVPVYHSGAVALTYEFGDNCRGHTLRGSAATNGTAVFHITCNCRGGP